MLFHDVVREERYDLWIGDEAWELDYYLHENPREKRVPFAWLTDFVGFLPMDDGGRAGELPDRRLQRRHGRPRRPPPRGPRPGAVRRQPRGHRPGAARAGAADDPRLDRAQLRLHRLRDRLRPRRPRRSHASCAPSSATATTSASASSPSAAQASAPTCCGGSSPPSRRPRSASPSCA